MTDLQLARFRAKYTISDQSCCWVWTGSRCKGGYGRITQGGSVPRLAHRVAYEHFIGPIPDDKQIDHLCRNRACVNPWHLEPVTGQVNIQRGNSARHMRQLARAKSARLTCSQGHEWTDANTYWRTHADGRRVRSCHTCRRVRREAYRAKVWARFGLTAKRSEETRLRMRAAQLVRLSRQKAEVS